MDLVKAQKKSGAAEVTPLRRYHLVLAALAVLLAIAAIPLAKSVVQLVMLGAQAAALLLLLIPESLRLVRGFHPSRAGNRQHRRKLLNSEAVLIWAAWAGIGGFVVNFIQWVGPYRGPGQGEVVDVGTVFADLMVTGDVEDVYVMRGPESDIFTYTPSSNGGSQHVWQSTYKDGAINSKPAKFGGVMYVNDRLPGQPGVNAHDGEDLSCCMSKLSWDARSDSQGATVNFVFGGITWRWQGNQMVPLPHPDTLPYRPLGTYRLDENWRSFSFDLRRARLSAADVQRVIGAFGWTLGWPGPIPQVGRTYTLEIRNVRYER
jgi:hypothetical protein